MSHQDMFGREIYIGNWVLHGVRQGNVGGLEYGRVVKKTDNFIGVMKPRGRAMSRIYTCDRLCVVPFELIPEKDRGAVDKAFEELIRS